MTSVSPGSTPTVPMNAAIGTRTPGIWSEVAVLAVELPVDHVRVGEQVAQEAEARHDHRVAVLIGLDVDQRDREHVALLGALDEHRSGERVHQVEIERGDVVRGRVDGQVAVERIAGLEHDVIARLGPRHGRDRRMIAIEAVRVVGAMGAALLDHDPVLPGDVAGVGLCRARKACARERQDRPKCLSFCIVASQLGPCALGGAACRHSLHPG